jgi:hypothetical protein
LKKHKSWFEEGCSKLLGQKKQAKLQWLQDPSEINTDKLNNVRCEGSRYFRNKKREYLKDKINEVALNSRNKNNDENGDLLAYSHNILNRWKNYFFQLLSVQCQ